MSTTPFLERDEALAALAADVASAARGEGRIVLVSGEAGIGKTALLERFVAAAPAGRVLWGACEALSTPQPLGPLHDIARSGAAPLRERLAAHAEGAALFGAVLDELATPPSPVVLVIEDVHWADAATLDLIRFVGRRLPRVAAAMVLSYRDDELDAAHPLHAALGHLPAHRSRRLTLSRLSPASVRRLATAGLRSDAGVYAATGGNPFFVAEVLASPDRAVPATVSDAVLARAATLDATARVALDLAAIVPRAVEAALLEQALGEVDGGADGARAIDACVAAGLLVVDEATLRFRHELARDAIEAVIAPHRRRRLHAAVFAILSRTPSIPLARLVHHVEGADLVDAIALGQRAAREAAARGARREAAAHSRAVLRRASGLPATERAALLDDYATHAFELNDLDAAIPARAEAIALFEAAGDRLRQGRALAAQAMPLVRALRNADADAASLAAIAIAEALGDDGLRARAYATEAYLRMLNRDAAAAVAWGDRAIALAGALGDDDTLAFAHNSRGAALLFVDDATDAATDAADAADDAVYARAIAGISTSLDLARRLPDGGVRTADAYVMLGTGSGEVQRYAEAERWLDEGIAFAAARDLDRLAGYMAAWQALVDVLRGRWDLAAARAQAVLATAQAGSTNRVVALVALGRLRTRRGDADAAPLLDEALDLATRTGTLQRVAPVRAARAEAAWLAGDRDAVAREASAALGLAFAKRHRWLAGELAFWSWRAGRPAPSPFALARPYAAQIAGRWREAAALWAGAGCPYEEAGALADGDEAAQRTALALCDGLGARPAAERLRHALRTRGVAAVPRGPRPSTRGNAAGLTAREVQVLALAAQGLHNAQIAARLSRSVRTVEHHVAAILAKLDVATRGEAVDAARRRGLLPQDG